RATHEYEQQPQQPQRTVPSREARSSKGDGCSLAVPQEARGQEARRKEACSRRQEARRKEACQLPHEEDGRQEEERRLQGGGALPAKGQATLEPRRQATRSGARRDGGQTQSGAVRSDARWL